MTLHGTLAGARAGMAGVSYELVGSATFPDGRNPGCTTSSAETVLSCPDAGNGPVDLVVRPVDRHAATDVSIGAYPRPPFVSVGSGHTTSLTLPGRPTHDFSLTGLTVTGHTVAGETDTYQVAGTVGDLPSDVDGLDLAVTGAGIAAQQADPRCHPATVDGAEVVHCSGLRTHPDFSLTLTSSQAVSHAVTVTVLPADPYDDPEPDPTSDADTVTVSPGTNLTLTTPAGALSRGDGGSYAVPVTLGGVRGDLPAVVLTLAGGATYAENQPDCTRISDTRLRCADPVDGDLTLRVVADDPTHATDLTVTATPGGDFEQLGAGNVARPSLRATYDFSIGELTRTAQTVSGGTDSYTLRTTVGDRPSGVDPLTLTVTGARFAPGQPDCTYDDATHVRCGSGPVDLVVTSTTTASHSIGVSLGTPAGYDDPTPGNDTRSITVKPGVDLSLADLDPDNESPANDDARHLVSTRLAGTRAGLGSVTYTLTGNATFVGANVPGCTADGTTLVCTDPADGPVTFTVQARDVHVATDIRIAVAAPNGFLELDGSDNSDGVRLLPRPTYDFSMGALRAGTHTVSGATDHYTLTSQVAAVPAGVSGLTFAVTGGTFATGQGAGCSRVDATHVSCGDLGSARDVQLRVESTSDAAHDVGLSLQVPRGYDDPDASNDSRSIAVTPGHRPGAQRPDAGEPGAGGHRHLRRDHHAHRGAQRPGPVHRRRRRGHRVELLGHLRHPRHVRRAHRGPAGLLHAPVGQGHRRHRGDGPRRRSRPLHRARAVRQRRHHDAGARRHDRQPDGGRRRQPGRLGPRPAERLAPRDDVDAAAPRRHRRGPGHHPGPLHRRSRGSRRRGHRHLLHQRRHRPEGHQRALRHLQRHAERHQRLVLGRRPAQPPARPDQQRHPRRRPARGRRGHPRRQQLELPDPALTRHRPCTHRHRPACDPENGV